MMINNPTAYIRDIDGIMYGIVARIEPGPKPTVELTFGTFRVTLTRDQISTLDTFFNQLDTELIEAQTAK